MFKVRFHLGRGPYYRYWQITDLKDKDAGPMYINPETSQLVLIDCELYVNEKKANKVYAAGRKDVCGWIKCSHVHWHDTHLSNVINVDNFASIKFNPIIDTNWRISTDYNLNLNNAFFEKLITKGKNVYLPERMSICA